MKDDKKYILLTGGLGYIGSHGAVAFIEEGYHVVIVDNLSNSSLDVLDSIEKITGIMPDFYDCDLRNKTNLEKIFEKYNFDGVLHFAGKKSPGESTHNAIDYFDNNIVGGLYLFECMEKYGVRKIAFSSSANIYSKQEMGELGINENAHVGNTTNPYGKTKFLLENILEDLAKFSGFQVASLRYFNPVGAHESGFLGEDPEGIPNNLVPYIMKVVSGELSELQVFGGDYNTIDGTGVRDYIDINDLIEGHVLGYSFLSKQESQIGLFEAFNLGTGKGVSVLEMIRCISEIIGKELPYKIVERREGDLGEVFCNPRKANEILNWKAENKLYVSLVNTLKYHKTKSK